MVYDGLYVLSVTKFSVKKKLPSFWYSYPFMTTKHSKFLVQVQLFMTTTLLLRHSGLDQQDEQYTGLIPKPLLFLFYLQFVLNNNTHHSLATVCVCVCVCYEQTTKEQKPVVACERG